MSEIAPAATGAPPRRAGNGAGDQPEELLRAEGFLSARFPEFPEVDAAHPAVNTLLGLKGLSNRAREAWLEALDARRRHANDPMASDLARATRTAQEVERLLTEVGTMAAERLDHSERAYRRLQGERAERVKPELPGCQFNPPAATADPPVLTDLLQALATAAVLITVVRLAAAVVGR